MARPRGSLRIGPISVFTLVVLISLSVMSVLTITTANASRALAEKQSSIVQESYLNEASAQHLIAQIDTLLQDAQSNGMSRAAALERIQSILPDGSTVSENVITVFFFSGDRRFLEIEIKVTDDLHYVVNRWRASTEWVPDTTGPNLWPGQKD